MDHPPRRGTPGGRVTRYGEYRILPCFGWMILIVRDHKNEKHDEKRN